MKPKSLTLGLAIAGAGLGLACVEESYDPWRPAPEPVQPASEHPVAGDALGAQRPVTALPLLTCHAAVVAFAGRPGDEREVGRARQSQRRTRLHPEGDRLRAS